MIIEWRAIHDTEAIMFYCMQDVIGFGGHKGESVKHLIDRHVGHLNWLLHNQSGFGLNAEALEYYEAQDHRYTYPNSKRGLTKTELVQVPTKWHIIDKQTTTFQPILGVNTMKRAILVRHDNIYQPADLLGVAAGDDHAYLTNIDDLAEGDFVVVDCSNGLQVCRVTKLIGLTPRQISKAFKWVVVKVDLEQHKKNIAAQEKIQELQNMVAARKEQIDGLLVLKMMAKEDPTMLKLLRELGGLDATLIPSGILDAPKKGVDGQTDEDKKTTEGREFI